ncbi:MAG: GFA family protein [bacterium]
MKQSNHYQGRCSCGKLRYRFNNTPLVVHACHCRQCQRVTGTAFVMNAVIEKNELEILSGEASHCLLPGTGHTAFFCPTCGTYCWSEYANSRNFKECWFVRVGTLDEPDRLPPDVHIYTESKQPWLKLTGEIPVFGEFYSREDVFDKLSHTRLASFVK